MKKLIFITLIMFSSLLANSEEYQLFRPSSAGNQYPGESIKGYDQIIKEIKPGDVLRFSNDKSFTVEKILGNGMTTKVLGVEGNKALRIPLMSRYNVLIWNYLEGAKELAKTDVKMAKVYHHLSKKFEYILVDQYNISMTLSTFIYKQDRLDEEDLAFKKKKLKKFLISTSQLLYIDDFKIEQVAWDEDHQRWILLDWLQHNVLKTSKEEEFAVQDQYFWGSLGKIFSPDELENLLKKMDKKFRKKSSCISTILPFFKNKEIPKFVPYN
jgi:hypothetical protein